MQASTNSEIFNIKARAKQANVFKYSSRQVNSKKTMVPFSCQSHDHGSLGAFGLLDFVKFILANHDSLQCAFSIITCRDTMLVLFMSTVITPGPLCLLLFTFSIIA